MSPLVGFADRVRTVVALGPANVGRVLAYRGLLRVGLHPVQRLPSTVDPDGRYFAAPSVPRPLVAPSAWRDASLHFGWFRSVLGSAPPDWFLNPFTGQRAPDADAAWWTITDFDPRIGAGIEAMIAPNTQVIFLESPGSLTLEIQDVPAIMRVAKARGIATIIDDTWSAGLHFKPFDHGIDVSVQALTKYQAGHADVLLGAALARDRAHVARLKQTVKELGIGCGAAEDAYLALRGLRTMPLRLERQSASALAVAQWLSRRPEVAQVLHPALESHPDHALFKRDFTGAASVFSIVLKPVAKARLAAMLDHLALFGLGFSWGGYESLVINCIEQETRKVARWTAPGALLRLSIGLEDPADLIADLEAGLARLAG